MASKDDDVIVSDEDDDTNKLTQTWPDKKALSSDRVHFIQGHNEKAVRLYTKCLSKTSTVYPMTTIPRGNVLVINNERFPSPHQRKGTEKDIEKITAVFSQLGFHVIVHHNLTKDDMEKTLSGASKRDYSDHDCLIIFILSHGNKGIVFGTDGNLQEGSNSVSISDIIKLFSDNESLLGKPKLFFIQACQGNQRDKGKTLDDEPRTVSHWQSEASPMTSEQKDSPHIGPVNNSDEMSEDEETTDGPKIPSEADVFLSTATVEGYVSWRDPKIGTWYIQAIGYVFRRFAYKHDLNQLMTLVNNLVSKSETKVKQYKQVAARYDTLTKTFYFFPCLHEPYVEIMNKFQQEKLEKERLQEHLNSLCINLEDLTQQKEEWKAVQQNLTRSLEVGDRSIANLTEQLDNEKSFRVSLEKELATLKQQNIKEKVQRQELENALIRQRKANATLAEHCDRERALRTTLENELESLGQGHKLGKVKEQELQKVLQTQSNTIASLKFKLDQEDKIQQENERRRNEMF